MLRSVGASGPSGMRHCVSTNARHTIWRGYSATTRSRLNLYLYFSFWLKLFGRFPYNQRRHFIFFRKLNICRRDFLNDFLKKYILIYFKIYSGVVVFNDRVLIEKGPIMKGITQLI